MLQYAQFLLCVGELVDHQGLDIAQAVDDLLLQFGRFYLCDHFLHVAVFPFQVLLLQSVVFSLDLL